MIPPATTGASTPASRRPSMIPWDQLAVRARQDRQADDVDPLLQRGGDDLRGGQADPFVDDLHPDVTRTQGDLLGAVGVTVEPRLADEDLDPAPERLADAGDLLAQGIELDAPAE
jgi:hypothetical protein